MKSLEAKALHAYILRDRLCHPEYIVEQKKYKRIFTLLRWKYRKIWKQIEAKIGMSIYRGLRSQNDYITKLLCEI
jgi:hypothetical protein